jgi:hypothetical protein
MHRKRGFEALWRYVDDVVRGALEEGQARGRSGDDAAVRRPVAVEAADELREDEDAPEGLRQCEGVAYLGELMVDELEVLCGRHPMLRVD